MHVATKEANIDVLKFLFQVGANKNVMVREKWLVIIIFNTVMWSRILLDCLCSEVTSLQTSISQT